MYSCIASPLVLQMTGDKLLAYVEGGGGGGGGGSGDCGCGGIGDSDNIGGLSTTN